MSVSQSGDPGCKHAFTYGTSGAGPIDPPSLYLTWCAKCGTSGRWVTKRGTDGGHWEVVYESEAVKKLRELGAVI